MIRAAVWWEERLWAEGLQATWVRLATTEMFMVAATRSSSLLHHDADFNWVELFLLICFISLFDGVMESHCCLCKCYNAYVSTETAIFYCTSNPKQYLLFLVWRYLFHCISYFGCRSKHHLQFSLMLHVTIILVCFMLVVPFLCILPLFWLSC